MKNKRRKKIAELIAKAIDSATRTMKATDIVEHLECLQISSLETKGVLWNEVSTDYYDGYWTICKNQSFELTKLGKELLPK